MNFNTNSPQGNQGRGWGGWTPGNKPQVAANQGSWAPSNKPQVAANQGSWSNISPGNGGQSTDPAQQWGGGKPKPQLSTAPQQPQQGRYPGQWQGNQSGQQQGGYPGQWGMGQQPGGQPQGTWGGGTPQQGGQGGNQFGGMADIMGSMYGNWRF